MNKSLNHNSQCIVINIFSFVISFSMLILIMYCFSFIYMQYSQMAFSKSQFLTGADTDFLFVYNSSFKNCTDMRLY